MNKEKTVTKTFLMKKPDGTQELVTLKYSREELAAPIYIARSE